MDLLIPSAGKKKERFPLELYYRLWGWIILNLQLVSWSTKTENLVGASQWWRKHNAGDKTDMITSLRSFLSRGERYTNKMADDDSATEK